MMSSRMFSRTASLLAIFPLLLMLAACGGGGSSSGSDNPGQDKNDPETPIPDPPETLPALQVEAEVGDGRISVSWSTQKYPQTTTFDLCVATETIEDMDSCSILTDGDYQSGVASPHIISGLLNGETYYFRVEASAEGYEPALSSLLSAIPESQTNIPGRNAVEVISYAESGNDYPTDVISLGDKAIIYYDNLERRSTFTVADGINPPVEIVVGEGSAGSYTKLHLVDSLVSLESRMVNGKRYFRAGASGANDLWVTDGTQQGTQRVVDGQALGLFRFRDITAVGDQIAFIGLGSEGERLYFLNENAPGGAVRVAEGVDANYSSTRPYLVPYEDDDGGFFLLSGRSDGERRIYRVDAEDGQAESLYSAGATGPGAGFGPYNLTVNEGMLYFIDKDENSDNQLRTVWLMDLNQPVGSVTVERLFNPSNSQMNIANPQYLHAVGDSVYFGVNRWTDHAGYNTNACRIMAARGLVYEEVSGVDFHCGHDFTYPFVTLDEQLLLQSPKEPDVDRKWWLVENLPHTVMVDDEPLPAPGLTVTSDGASRYAASIGAGAWLVNKEQDRLVHIDGETRSTFVATAENGGELNTINTLTNVNGNPWFTACLAPAISNCRGVWWVPPEQEEIGAGGSN